MIKTAAIQPDLGGLGWFCHQYIQVSIQAWLRQHWGQFTHSVTVT